MTCSKNRIILQPFAQMMALAADFHKLRKWVWAPPDCKACYTLLRGTPSIEMFVRVQYTNLSCFYPIEARARGNLTRNLTRLMFRALIVQRDRYCLLVIYNLLTQMPPRQKSG